MISVLLIAQSIPTSQALLSYLQIKLTVYHAYPDENTAAAIVAKDIDIVLIEGDRDPRFIFRALRWVRYRQDVAVPTVVYCAQDNPETIIKIMKYGVDDYVLKTKNFDQMQASLISCLHNRPGLHESAAQSDEAEDEHTDTLYGSSPHTKKTRAFIRKFAPTDATVMLYGESGTGKTLVARMLHERSERRNHAFRSINCAAIPETLVESELFGSEVGAFTGAVRRRGIFTRAHRGTLFLDELGDLSLPSQSKLLQAIEEKRYTPLGGENEHEVDIRFISATNKDMRDMIATNQFRLDLYYRMAVLCYTIAPLRERTEDIIPIAWRFLRQTDDKKFFSTGAVDKLMHHEWRGNIRELKNCIARAMIISDGNRICASDIIFYM